MELAATDTGELGVRGRVQEVGTAYNVYYMQDLLWLYFNHHFSFFNDPQSSETFHVISDLWAHSLEGNVNF